MNFQLEIPKITLADASFWYPIVHTHWDEVEVYDKKWMEQVKPQHLRTCVNWSKLVNWSTDGQLINWSTGQLVI